MSQVLYIVPTRGRPEAAAELCAVWRSSGATARLLFAVDHDDPTLEEYIRMTDRGDAWLWTAGTHTMVEALNVAAMAHVDQFEYIGFMGDDHCPETYAWDTLMVDAMCQMNALFGYADDCIQGPNLPTQVLIRSDVIKTLGHMAPSSLTHLYVDNYWMHVGQGVRRMLYIPHVVIRHKHPITGKVPWTEGHKRVNDGAMYARDAAAFGRYIESGRLANDISLVEAL